MYDNIWQSFFANTVHHVQRNRGDQDWMYRHIKNFSFWPDEWIQSYKWEMIGLKDTKLLTKDGRKFFRTPATIKDENKVAVFHGEPKPFNCADQWVVDNWK